MSCRSCIDLSARSFQKPAPKWLGIFVVYLCVGSFCFLGCGAKTTPEKIDSVGTELSLTKLDQPDPLANQELRGESLSLEDRIRRIVERNRDLRPLHQSENAAWQVFHGAVAYGANLLLEVDGKPVPALNYLFQGGELPGWEPRLGDKIESTGRFGLKLPVEEGSYTGQGHVDQFLGYISQAKVPLDTIIHVGGETITLEDWARQAQRDIGMNPYREYSWTLIALANYFPDDMQWEGSDGKQWALESFVQFEAEQDLARSACGGMHRLMGLAHCVRLRENQGRRFEGGWLKAKKVVDETIATARAYQNSDGTFSTRYTVRPANSSDLGACIGATGHTLEFLAYAVPQTELSAGWLERAVLKLCQMLEATESMDLECGAGYHALSGLRLYAERRFGLEL